MKFLNPLVLFGLGAAAIPILIHLFTKRRPREVPFSSLEFLTEVHQREIRRLKLKQWLLLALRTLAIAALAIAMARPAVKGGTGGSASSSLVALVDVSGSMGAPGADGRPLAAAARRAVEDLLATLGPGDELLLVPYDRAPRPVSEKPLGDAGRLRAAPRPEEGVAPKAQGGQPTLSPVLWIQPIQWANQMNRNSATDRPMRTVRAQAVLRVRPLSRTMK